MAQVLGPHPLELEDAAPEEDPLPAPLDGTPEDTTTDEEAPPTNEEPAALLLLPVLPLPVLPLPVLVTPLLLETPTEEATDAAEEPMRDDDDAGMDSADEEDPPREEDPACEDDPASDATWDEETAPPDEDVEPPSEEELPQPCALQHAQATRDNQQNARIRMPFLFMDGSVHAR